MQSLALAASACAIGGLRKSYQDSDKENKDNESDAEKELPGHENQQVCLIVGQVSLSKGS